MNKTKICIKCHKEFSKNRRGKAWEIAKYCSQTCYLGGNIPWNKGIKSDVKPWLGKKRPDMVGEKNPSWKAEGISYTHLHDWIRATLGKRNKCDFCGTTELRRYEWANKSRTYKRDLADWLRLCVPCHRKYDIRKEQSAL